MEFTKDEVGIILKSILEHISKLEHMEKYPTKQKDLEPYQKMLTKFLQYKEEHFYEKNPLDDITKVGPKKPVGYIHALDLKEAGLTPESIIKIASEKRLKTAHFMEGFSGEALYVWDESALADLLQRNKKILSEAILSLDPGEFITYIAKKEIEPGTKLFDLVAEAFGDISNKRL